MRPGAQPPVPPPATRPKSPVGVTALSVRGTVPLLERVTACAEVAVPTPVAAKVSVPGVTDTPAPAIEVPVSCTIWAR